MPSLILLKSPEGASPNENIPLNADIMILGRDEESCQIVIPHHAVSKRHAQITRTDDQYFIEDLKSRNKTFVNDKELPPATRQSLKPDDRIKICDFLFRFHAEAPPHADFPDGTHTIVAGAVQIPDYMAPEQIFEQPDKPPSEATDMHSVGVMLFHMLTGELPFEPGLNEGAKLDVIVNRRFVSCVQKCREKGFQSRLAPLIDYCLKGVYAQSRFLLADLLSGKNRPSPPRLSPPPKAKEPFLVTALLFEDRLTHTFAAVGAKSGVPVYLRLVKPKFDGTSAGRLICELPTTPADAPVGILRRYRLERGQPIPVRPGTRFALDGSATKNSCFTIIEENAGTRTLMAAIRANQFVGDDLAVLRVAIPLLETLGYVHTQGAIHARLTPYCVFLPDSGWVRIEGLHIPKTPAPQLTSGIHAAVDQARMQDSGDSDGGNTTIEAMESKKSQQFLEVGSSDRFRALLDISTRLSRGFELDPLLTQIADTLLDMFKQADRCFVLLLNKDGTPIPKVMKSRRTGSDNTRFSRILVKKCVESRQSYLSEDASSDTSLGLAASIAEFKIRSVMCVPFVNAEGQVIGAIQLDTQDRAKKFTVEDLNLLVLVANLTGVAIQNVNLHEAALEHEKERMQIELARKVQLGSLPQTLPEVPGYEFYAYYSARMSVSGDYYDFISLPGGRIAVALGDVAGWGVPSALLVARLIPEVRFCLLTVPNLAQAVCLMNERMIQSGLGDRFITATILVLDPARHELTIVNAGHMNPKWYRAATGELVDAISLDATGLPFGALPDYPFEEVTITLDPGDSIALFTDGMTDAMNANSKMFSSEAVEACILAGGPNGARYIGELLVAAVQQHRGDCRQNDDIAIVCFGRKAEGSV